MAGPLEPYRAKRDTKRSGEPAGKRRASAARAGASAKPRFVVQEHSASRLHWDLRLEHDGVLASWALPRFLPGSSGDNRLAVRTEDHPLEYLEFEGEIPAGSYGAGTMSIFDHGTFEVLKWEPRKIEVELHGERLRGSWALFPLARKGERGDDWMIHRMGEPLDPGAAPLPEQLAPMLASAGVLPKGAGWAFEVKWDGVRALCHAQPGVLRLRSRNGNDVTAGYPELAALTRALHEHAVILDGEIVAFDDGRPSFQALQRRMHVRDGARVKRLAQELPVTYVIFDLLWRDGRSLLERPYAERRSALDELGLHGEHWQVPGFEQDGIELLAAAEQLGLEGVVAKRLDGAYLPGRRSSSWVKVKRLQSAEFQVGGWVEGTGSRRGRIGALLVGDAGEDGALRYCGRVGSGFSEAELDRVAALLEPLAREQSPFAENASATGPPRGAHFVEPQLTAEVQYSERSKGGALRHPVWRGLRADLPPALVIDEHSVASAAGREIPLTNLDKVIYPRAGFRKRQVIDYYARIAPLLVPHLAGRALTLRRWPDGVDGQSFFEKRAPPHAPPWVAQASVRHGSKDISFVLADDLPTLVWLAQLAALELHPSLALAAAPEHPTCVVFDLDPGAPATIVECCRLALLVRGMLDGLGLSCLAKTSGSKGLQLYVPLNRGAADFEQTKAFSRAVAELLAGEEPELVVATQAKRARTGRVLIDWSQNDRSKTTIAVYSLRARERPTVSTPLLWDEVEACAASGDPEQLVFDARAVLERAERHGDLFAELLSVRQALPG